MNKGQEFLPVADIRWSIQEAGWAPESLLVAPPWGHLRWEFFLRPLHSVNKEDGHKIVEPRFFVSLLEACLSAIFNLRFEDVGSRGLVLGQ